MWEGAEPLQPRAAPTLGAGTLRTASLGRGQQDAPSSSPGHAPEHSHRPHPVQGTSRYQGSHLGRCLGLSVLPQKGPRTQPEAAAVTERTRPKPGTQPFPEAVFMTDIREGVSDPAWTHTGCSPV